MEFITIDVETANPDFSSICQIGLCHYKDGVLIKEFNQYLNPDDWFDDFNTMIHGITENDIADKPLLSEKWNEINDFVGGKVVVSHTSFDRTALHTACLKYDIDLDWGWSDSAKMLRRSFEEYRYTGYGLKNICKAWGYKFKHHDALEDAKACGFVVLEIMNRTNSNIEDLVKLAGYRNNPNSPARGITRDGSPGGAFYGQQICFTGELSIPRAQAADMAHEVGFEVKRTASKKLEYLVVGDQDITKLAGKNKSSKQIKVESLIEQGIPIRIIKESDFYELIKE